MLSVDVLMVLGEGEEPEPEVLESLDHQGEVRLTLHRVRGPRRDPGESRASAIARARNLAKSHGTCKHAMFLDRDVVLPPLGVQKLLYGLLFHPHHAALGILYQEGTAAWASAHVAMGATLFHRSILDRLTFRAEPDYCECYCCCMDIRRMGYEIGYHPLLRARHLPRKPLF
jgi:hypothetical protein